MGVSPYNLNVARRGAARNIYHLAGCCYNFSQFQLDSGDLDNQPEAASIGFITCATCQHRHASNRSQPK